MRTVTKCAVALQATSKRALVSQFEKLEPSYRSTADTSTITPLRRVKTGAVAEFSVQRVLTCILKGYWRQITMPVALAAVWQVAPPDTFLCWAELPLFSGIGLSFPDVVINDRILGGETPKTKGMRENKALDYEMEFAKLASVSESMGRYCMDGIKVRIINDGPMAAFSAAAELAQDGDAQLGESGVIAHSLGTDLGSGWIKADGEIPAIPLELYDLLLDLGSARQKEYAPEDLRSVRNENSGLAGVRRYLGQAAAYRMAQQLEPALLDGFTEERGDVLSIITAPEDMRKPCLEHIMNAATYGDEAACEIFRRVGANLAQLTKEMEYLLDTGTDRRFLFGRFVKNESCFRLIREGFAEVMPEVSLIAADDGLARSGLMRQLAAREDVTVAQFAQAVSAIYYSRM